MMDRDVGILQNIYLYYYTRVLAKVNKKQKKGPARRQVPDGVDQL